MKFDYPSPEDLCYDKFILRPPNTKNVSTYRLYIQYIYILIKVFKPNPLYISTLNKKFYKQKKLLVVIGTINHKTVFECFRKFIKHEIEIWGSFGKKNLANYPRMRKPNFMKRVIILLFLINQEVINNRFHKNLQILRTEIYNAYILLIQFEQILKKKYISVLLFNDHISWYRAILIACKRLNIPTIYIPHASISYRFPPLIFDLAILEGEDMFHKYMNIGPIYGEVKLIGNPKFDFTNKKKCKFSYIKKINSLSIGIAFNYQNQKNGIVDLGNSLFKNLKTQNINEEIKIVVRPHPSLRNVVDEIVMQNKLYLSDSSMETSIEFLNNVDILLSTDSNIILESLLAEKPVIFIELNSHECIDNYGFVKNGLVNKPLSKISDIISSIQEYKTLGFKIPKKIKSKLKYYNAAIDSVWEGVVGKKIAFEIDEFIRKQ